MPRQAGDLGQIRVIVPALQTRHGPRGSGEQDNQNSLNDAGPAFADVPQEQGALPVGVVGVRAAEEANAEAGNEALEAAHASEKRHFTLRQQFINRARGIPAAVPRIR